MKQAVVILCTGIMVLLAGCVTYTTPEMAGENVTPIEQVHNHPERFVGDRVVVRGATDIGLSMHRDFNIVYPLLNRSAGMPYKGCETMIADHAYVAGVVQEFEPLNRTALYQEDLETMNLTEQQKEHYRKGREYLEHHNYTPPSDEDISAPYNGYYINCTKIVRVD